ncbi:MAG: betaine--homocysteine S-methyltransferase [Acidimicrobiales bacterium]|nr:betaine--homocysteine S-methyltransferase [Acidimicrobiales bacterium]
MAVANAFLSLLGSSGPVLADGAMGTSLFAAGLESGDPPEMWNLDHPDRVLQIHADYVAAGSEILLTNSFGGNALRLKLHGLQERVVELNQAAAQLARRAADTAERPVVVAGSMGPTGELLEPMGLLTHELCQMVFADQARGLESGGADVLWLETLSDLGEVRDAISGIRTVSSLPLVVTMSFDTAGRTMMGVHARDMAMQLAELGVAAIGANCGNNLADTEAALLEMAQADTGVPLVGKANAGIPEWKGTGLVYSGTPEVMGAHAHRLTQQHVKIIGGCCGSSHEHLRLMRGVIDGVIPVPDVAVGTASTPVGSANTRSRRRASSR